MNKATNIQWEAAKKGGFVTAKVGNHTYQRWFEDEPCEAIKMGACGAFEYNYSQLNEQARKPVIVKQHHSERG